MLPALFLDRDGVININHGYVSEIDSFDFIPGIFSIVKQATERGYVVIVVTNQSGIGRGYYTQERFVELTRWMVDCFKENGGRIDEVYHCPHHPTGAKGEFLKKCDCRKPKTGMFTRAINAHQIDVKNSIMIGDKKSDLIAAETAGVGHRVLFSEDTKQSSEYQTVWLRQSDLVGVELADLCTSNSSEG